MWTLLHLKYRKHVFAGHGEGGASQNCTGANGKDVVLDVPLGTMVRRADSGVRLGEIDADGQEIVVLRGGRGGKGNASFATSTNRSPQHAQGGEVGLEEWLILELKLLADVGLVGFPNAGKSTLLASVSAARPQIADYPFTTLTPHLGVVAYRDHLSFVMADIPGIIEGAAEGKGLGLRFLRHIERNSILLFMIPADADDVGRAYGILLNELRKYNPELLDKGRLIAVSKADLLDEELETALAGELPAEVPHVFISSVTGKGLERLKDMIWAGLHKQVPL